MKTHLIFLWLLLVFTACSRPGAMQPSVSLEAYKMDKEAKSVFVETNPISASFSIILGPTDRGVCTAYAKFYGFRDRKDYLLFCLNTGDSHSPIAMHSLAIEDGYVIEKENDHEIKRNSFAFHVPSIPGFASTWYLWAEDSSIRLCQQIVPKTLQAVGFDGATLAVVRKESGGNFVDIAASGLKKEEQVCFVVRSLGEEFYYPGKAPENGKLQLPVVSSFVGLKRGVMSGTTSILLVREYETLEVTHDWDLSTTQVAAKK